MSRQQVTYDGSDSSVFEYTGSWLVDGTWAASNGQSGTLATTNDLNGYVTITFPTAAVSFTYYGIKRSRGGLYGVCIDCNINNPSFTTIDGFDATDNGQNPPVALYSTSWTQPGVHTVLIKNEADNRGTPAGNSQLTMDRIVIEVLVQPSTTSTTQVPTRNTQLTTTTTTSPISRTTTTTTTGSSSSSSSSSGSTTGATSTTSTSSSGSSSPMSGSTSTTEPGALAGGSLTQSLPSSSGVPFGATEPSSAASPESGHSSHLGAIIGAVLGSLAVIGLILLIVLCLRRRRNNAAAISKTQAVAFSGPTRSPPPPTSTVEPFVLSSGTAPSSAPTSQGEESLPTPASDSLVEKTTGSSMEKRRSMLHRRIPSAPSQSSSSVLQESFAPPSTTQGWERDGGPLSIYTVDEDLPPEYSQLYSS